MRILTSNKLGLLSAAAIALGALAVQPAGVVAQDNPMVGGAPMMASKNIVENASKSKDHETLVQAVKQADLVDTLSGEGPFTVFAPTDAAFEALPAGTVESLMQDKNKQKLTNILTYHVVKGDWTAQKIMEKAEANNGKFQATTVSGDPVTVSVKGDKVTLMDESGNTATVTIANVDQSNGVIHVIDTVLLPKA